jgi:hypothetical protein
MVVEEEGKITAPPGGVEFSEENNRPLNNIRW